MGKIKCECCLGEGIVRPLGCPHGMPCPICHGGGETDESLKEAATKQRAKFLGEAFFALILGGVFAIFCGMFGIVCALHELYKVLFL